MRGLMLLVFIMDKRSFTAPILNKDNREVLALNEG